MSNNLEEVGKVTAVTCDSLSKTLCRESTTGGKTGVNYGVSRAFTSAHTRSEHTNWEGRLLIPGPIDGLDEEVLPPNCSCFYKGRHPIGWCPDDLPTVMWPDKDEVEGPRSRVLHATLKPTEYVNDGRSTVPTMCEGCCDLRGAGGCGLCSCKIDENGSVIAATCPHQHVKYAVPREPYFCDSMATSLENYCYTVMFREKARHAAVSLLGPCPSKLRLLGVLSNTDVSSLATGTFAKAVYLNASTKVVKYHVLPLGEAQGGVDAFRLIDSLPHSAHVGSDPGSPRQAPASSTSSAGAIRRMFKFLDSVAKQTQTRNKLSVTKHRVAKTTRDLRRWILAKCELFGSCIRREWPGFKTKALKIFDHVFSVVFPSFLSITPNLSGIGKLISPLPTLAGVVGPLTGLALKAVHYGDVILETAMTNVGVPGAAALGHYARQHPTILVLSLVPPILLTQLFASSIPTPQLKTRAPRRSVFVGTVDKCAILLRQAVFEPVKDVGRMLRITLWAMSRGASFVKFQPRVSSWLEQAAGFVSLVRTKAMSVVPGPANTEGLCLVESREATRRVLVQDKPGCGEGANDSTPVLASNNLYTILEQAEVSVTPHLASYARWIVRAVHHVVTKLHGLTASAAGLPRSASVLLQSLLIELLVHIYLHLGLPRHNGGPGRTCGWLCKSHKKLGVWFTNDLERPTPGDNLWLTCMSGETCNKAKASVCEVPAAWLMPFVKVKSPVAPAKDSDPVSEANKTTKELKGSIAVAKALAEVHEDGRSQDDAPEPLWRSRLVSMRTAELEKKLVFGNIVARSEVNTKVFSVLETHGWEPKLVQLLRKSFPYYDIEYAPAEATTVLRHYVRCKKLENLLLTMNIPADAQQVYALIKSMGLTVEPTKQGLANMSAMLDLLPFAASVLDTPTTPTAINDLYAAVLSKKEMRDDEAAAAPVDDWSQNYEASTTASHDSTDPAWQNFQAGPTRPVSSKPAVTTALQALASMANMCSRWMFKHTAKGQLWGSLATLAGGTATLLTGASILLGTITTLSTVSDVYCNFVVDSVEMCLGPEVARPELDSKGKHPAYVHATIELSSNPCKLRKLASVCDAGHNAGRALTHAPRSRVVHKIRVVATRPGDKLVLRDGTDEKALMMRSSGVVNVVDCVRPCGSGWRDTQVAITANHVLDRESWSAGTPDMVFLWAQGDERVAWKLTHNAPHFLHFPDHVQGSKSDGHFPEAHVLTSGGKSVGPFEICDAKLTVAQVGLNQCTTDEDSYETAQVSTHGFGRAQIIKVTSTNLAGYSGSLVVSPTGKLIGVMSAQVNSVRFSDTLARKLALLRDTFCVVAGPLTTIKVVEVTTSSNHFAALGLNERTPSSRGGRSSSKSQTSAPCSAGYTVVQTFNHLTQTSRDDTTGALTALLNGVQVAPKSKVRVVESNKAMAGKQTVGFLRGMWPLDTNTTMISIDLDSSSQQFQLPTVEMSIASRRDLESGVLLSETLGSGAHVGFDRKNSVETLLSRHLVNAAKFAEDHRSAAVLQGIPGSLQDTAFTALKTKASVLGLTDTPELEDLLPTTWAFNRLTAALETLASTVSSPMWMDVRIAIDTTGMQPTLVNYALVGAFATVVPAAEVVIIVDPNATKLARTMFHWRPDVRDQLGESEHKAASMAACAAGLWRSRLSDIVCGGEDVIPNPTAAVWHIVCTKSFSPSLAQSRAHAELSWAIRTAKTVPVKKWDEDVFSMTTSFRTYSSKLRKFRLAIIRAVSLPARHLSAVLRRAREGLKEGALNWASTLILRVTEKTWATSMIGASMAKISRLWPWNWTNGAGDNGGTNSEPTAFTLLTNPETFTGVMTCLLLDTALYGAVPAILGLSGRSVANALCKCLLSAAANLALSHVLVTDRVRRLTIRRTTSTVVAMVEMAFIGTNVTRDDVSKIRDGYCKYLAPGIEQFLHSEIVVDALQRFRSTWCGLMDRIADYDARQPVVLVTKSWPAVLVAATQIACDVIEAHTDRKLNIFHGTIVLMNTAMQAMKRSTKAELERLKTKGFRYHLINPVGAPILPRIPGIAVHAERILSSYQTMTSNMSPYAAIMTATAGYLTNTIIFGLICYKLYKVLENISSENAVIGYAAAANSEVQSVIDRQTRFLGRVEDTMMDSMAMVAVVDVFFTSYIGLELPFKVVGLLMGTTMYWLQKKPKTRSTARMVIQLAAASITGKWTWVAATAVEALPRFEDPWSRLMFRAPILTLIAAEELGVNNVREHLEKMSGPPVASGESNCGDFGANIIAVRSRVEQVADLLVPLSHATNPETALNEAEELVSTIWPCTNRAALRARRKMVQEKVALHETVSRVGRQKTEDYGAAVKTVGKANRFYADDEDSGDTRTVWIHGALPSITSLIRHDLREFRCSEGECTPYVSVAAMGKIEEEKRGDPILIPDTPLELAMGLRQRTQCTPAARRAWQTLVTSPEGNKAVVESMLKMIGALYTQGVQGRMLTDLEWALTYNHMTDSSTGVMTTRLLSIRKMKQVMTLALTGTDPSVDVLEHARYAHFAFGKVEVVNKKKPKTRSDEITPFDNGRKDDTRIRIIQAAEGFRRAMHPKSEKIFNEKLMLARLVNPIKIGLKYSREWAAVIDNSKRYCVTIDITNFDGNQHLGLNLVPGFVRAELCTERGESDAQKRHYIDSTLDHALETCVRTLISSTGVLATVMGTMASGDVNTSSDNSLRLWFCVEVATMLAGVRDAVSFRCQGDNAVLEGDSESALMRVVANLERVGLPAKVEGMTDRNKRANPLVQPEFLAALGFRARVKMTTWAGAEVTVHTVVPWRNPDRICPKLYSSTTKGNARTMDAIARNKIAMWLFSWPLDENLQTLSRSMSVTPSDFAMKKSAIDIEREDSPKTDVDLSLVEAGWDAWVVRAVGLGDLCNQVINVTYDDAQGDKCHMEPWRVVKGRFKPVNETLRNLDGISPVRKIVIVVGRGYSANDACEKCAEIKAYYAGALVVERHANMVNNDHDMLIRCENRLEELFSRKLLSCSDIMEVVNAQVGQKLYYSVV